CYNWYFPTILVVVLAILNDGTILTISKDNVTASRTPDSWKLKSVFVSSIAFGLWLTLSTIVLFAVTYQTNAFQGFISAESLCVSCIKNDCDDYFTNAVRTCAINGNSSGCGELDGSVMKNSDYAALGKARADYIAGYWTAFEGQYKKNQAQTFEHLKGSHINNLGSEPEATEVYDQFVYQYTAGVSGKPYKFDNRYTVTNASAAGNGVAFIGHDYLPLTNGVGFCEFMWDYSNFNQTWTRDHKLIGPGMQKKDGILRSLVYAQVSISGQALIFVTRTAGINTWFFAEKPCNLLLIAFVFAQIVASVVGAVGFNGYPSDRVAVIGCGWGYLVIAWLWSIVWHFPLDLIKFAVNYILNQSTAYSTTAFTSRVNAGHPSMTHSKVTSVARSIRASRTVA
ncbi:hypothetical protein As57867_001762, partial [Aphanomyces stellatus]